MNKLVYLVPLFPLIGFLINGLGRKSLSKSLIGIIGSTTILASFVVSVFLFMDVKAHGASVVTAFNFINIDTFKVAFAFQIDQLSSLFLLIGDSSMTSSLLFETTLIASLEALFSASFFVFPIAVEIMLPFLSLTQ